MRHESAVPIVFKQVSECLDEQVGALTLPRSLAAQTVRAATNSGPVEPASWRLMPVIGMPGQSAPDRLLPDMVFRCGRRLGPTRGLFEDSYIGAVWEAFGEPHQPGRLKDWSRADRAEAQARLIIVCTDDDLLSIADSLRHNGRAMWHAAHSGNQAEWDQQ